MKEAKRYEQMCKDKVLSLFFTYELEGKKFDDSMLSPKSPSQEPCGKELINKQIFLQDELDKYEKINA